jgi:Holliday junction resolvasome RuvABC endonuclease subunit
MLPPHLQAKINQAKNKQTGGATGNGSALRVLALDVATKCGWATVTASGTWDFNLKRDESSGMRMVRFRNKLEEICRLENINLVVFERTAGRHAAAIIVQAELHGVLKLFCELNKIDYKAFSAKEIKKFATGNGNANKQKMVDAAKAKYKANLADDNEADALHIYHLAKSDLNF